MALRKLDRFWRAVDVRGDYDCWPWKGPLDKHGWPICGIDVGQGTRAQRVLVVLLDKELRRNDTVRLVCRNSACCNPRHIEVISRGSVPQRVKRALLQEFRKREYGVTLGQLAARYDVSRGYVKRLWARYKWDILEEQGYGRTSISG